MKFRKSPLRILVLLFCIFSSAAAYSQPYQLNQALGELSDVFSAQVSPDGNYVVFMANPNPNHLELFSVPVSGGPVVRLNGDLAVGNLGGGNFFYGDVASFKISPDSQHVIYTAHQRTTSHRELFSVPITGGAQTLLNRGDYHPFRPGTSWITEFEFTQDSQRVIFIHDFDAYQRNELYSVSTSGSGLTRLSPDLSGQNQNIKPFIRYRVAPNSQRVFFVINKAGDSNYELYSSPLASYAPTRLATPVQSEVFGLEGVTPNGQYAIFAAANGDNIFKLYSVPHNGSPAILLSGSITTDRGYQFDVKITPNGQRAIFSVPTVANSGSFDELWSVPISGGTPLKLSSNNVNDRGVTRYEISPNGQHVVFTDKAQKKVYRISPSGGARLQLNPNISGLSRSNRFENIKISNDSARVVYRLRRLSTGVPEALYSSPINSSEATRLNPPLPNNGKMGLFSISHDSDFVIYHAEQDSVGKRELYIVSIAGGLSVKLNSNLVAGGNVSDNGNGSWYHRRSFFLPEESGKTIAYIADQNTDEKFELFAVNLDTNRVPVVNITAPENGTRIDNGQKLNFSASALDFEDGDISNSITWHSNKDGVLGTGANLSSVLLSKGIHSISAKASDSKGKQGKATMTIRVGKNVTIAPILLLLLDE